MEKIFLFRTMLVALLVCILLWDVLLWITHHTTWLPHKDLLLAGALLWIITILLPQKSDDDNWAGEF